jgi:putative transcriptional regulator
MSLRFKVKVLDVLKEKGFSTYILRKEKLLSESTIQKLRAGEGVSWENIETLCRLLDCQPSDFMEYVTDDVQ